MRKISLLLTTSFILLTSFAANAVLNIGGKTMLKTKYGAGFSPSASGLVFDDVTVGTFAAGFIEDLNTEGAVGGCSDAPPLYCPSEMMTRGGFTKMLANTFGLMP